ncbi:hypothetical protein [Runella sp.]
MTKQKWRIGEGIFNGLPVEMSFGEVVTEQQVAQPLINYGD